MKYSECCQMPIMISSQVTLDYRSTTRMTAINRIELNELNSGASYSEQFFIKSCIVIYQNNKTFLSQKLGILTMFQLF